MTQGIRHQRSRTHPHTHLDESSHRKKDDIEPFDPDELCRRLEIHRKELSEARRRRRERVASAHRSTEKEAPETDAPRKAPGHDVQGSLAQEGEGHPYHHVPQFAALDFARTATPHSSDRKIVVHRVTQNAALEDQTLESSQKGFHNRSYSAKEPNSKMKKCEKSARTEDDQLRRSRTRKREIPKTNEGAIDNSNQENGDLIGKDPRSGGNIEDIPAQEYGEAAVMGNIEIDAEEDFERPKYTIHDRHDWTERDECTEAERATLIDKIMSLRVRKLRPEQEIETEIPNDQKPVKRSRSSLLALFK